MRSANIYCSFCGVVILTENLEDPESLAIRRPWYSEARAVTRDGTPGEIRITGVGIMRSRAVLHAPAEPGATYQETEDLYPVMLFEDIGAPWGFGFHDACWELLLLKLGITSPEGNDVLQCLFLQFINSPCPGYSCLDFGHDYGGAARTHKSWGLPLPVNPSSPLYADPGAIPSLEAIELTPPPKCPSLPRLESFAELVYEILSYIPYAQLVKLRLVCRDLAWKARPDQLPQSYWKSRFCLGQEFGFMCSQISMATRDWFRAYWGVTSLLIAGHLTLTNRERIWGLLEPIAALVEFGLPRRLAKDGYITFSSAKEEEYNIVTIGGATGDTPGVIRLAQSFSGQISQSTERGPVEDGCHMFVLRVVPFPSSQLHDGGQIKVSGFRLGAREVISGLSFSCANSMDEFQSRLGSCDAPIKWTILVPTKSLPESVEVAFCSLGLVGLRLVYRGGGFSNWAGQNQGEGIAYGKLHIPYGLGDSFLLAGMDDLKIVKLGLGRSGKQNGPDPFITSNLYIKEDQHISVPSRLWTPNIPEYENVMITRLIPGKHEGSFEPLVNIDFGNTGGQLLESLSRVVMHFLSHTHPIARIEFHYCDSTVKRFGTGPIAAELSFCIDGPGGERITRIGILQKPLELTVAGIELLTNRGRTAHFACLRQRVGNKDVHYFPVLPGHVITGLVGSIEGFKHTFSNLGIQSQPALEKDGSIISDMNEGSSEPPEAVLTYDQGFAEPHIRTKGVGEYQTYASLTDVKRIQVSVGLSGRSRLSNRISGLKLDFYHCGNPSIVGQWMKGTDEFAVDLLRDERIQSLTVWITKDAVSGNYSSIRQGQVAAICIETDRGQSLTFCPSTDEDFLDTCIMTQYQAGPCQKLAFLSWVLNSRFDRVRAGFSPDPQKHAVAIVPQLSAAFNQIQKLPFELLLDDGRYDRLVEITGHINRSAIRGFTFTYRSGQAWSVGDNHSQETQTVQVGPSDRLVGLSLRRADGIKEISFEVEQLAEDNTPECRHLQIAVPWPTGPDIYVDHGSLSIWSKDEASAETMVHVASPNAAFSPPADTRLAGIYVSCQYFAYLGCLYEPVM